MEAAFVLNQPTGAAGATNPDPFLYTVEFYGYSESAQFPGYLGYEIESIGLKKDAMKPSNDQYYWELSVNTVPSTAGPDTNFPGPGSTVQWTYTAITPATPLAARTQVVHARRASRAASDAASAVSEAPPATSAGS